MLHSCSIAGFRYYPHIARLIITGVISHENELNYIPAALIC